MYKILPFSKPIINHMPADASRLSILHAHNQILPIIHNFINIFAFNIMTYEGEYILDTQFYWNINEVERKLIPKAVVTDIVSLLWNSLQNNYYINICFDSCKLTSYKSYDRNKVRPHQMCIYGMDLEKKVCYCADFFSMNGYEQACIPIDDIKAANDSLHKETCNLDTLTGAMDWITDIELLKPLLHYGQTLNLELICKNIQYFLNGENMFGCASYTRTRPHVMTYDIPQDGKWLYEAEVLYECYGINVFEEIKHFLSKSLVNTKYAIHIKMFYIIHAYQKLMMFRLNYVKENTKDANLVNIIDQYDKLLTDSQLILYNGIKSGLVSKEKIKSKLIDLIESHIDNTREILLKVLEVLTSKV